MKKFYSLLIVLAFMAMLISMNSVFAQSVGIGASSFTPKTSSILEVKATNKGILIPRIALSGTNDVTTIATPTNSLLIFNTASVTGANAVSPGYYYRDTVSNQWVKFLTANTNAWLTDGNTNSALMTIGTKDANDFPIITNNAERMRVTSGGQVCIGTIAISAAGTDLEIRNTTTSSSPYPAPTISMRATNQIITSGHYMAKINLGDDFQTGPQAQIAVIRDGAGTSGDLPTSITFSTIPSGSTSLLERVRISNSGSVGINCIPNSTYKLDIQTVDNGAALRVKANRSALGDFHASVIIDKAKYSSNGYLGFSYNDSTLWQMGTYGNRTLKIRYTLNGTTIDVLSISSTSRKLGIGANSDNVNQLYALQTGTATDGSAFGTTSSRSAILGSGLDAKYNFGVNGFSPASYDHAGGVLGINGSSSWGALAYYSSGSINYGGYFSTHSEGGGFMSNDVLTGIGSASIGNIMGSWSRGELFGQTTMGELYASYNLGNEYTSGVSADIVTNNNERTAAYSVTSNDVKVYSDGKAQLTNGSCKVTFDKSFMQLISNEKNPTITVSALGECEGLYIVSIDKDGFTVKEFHNGQTNIEFTWIAIGKRVDADKVSKLPEALKDKDFDRNMKGVMFNENNKEKSGTSIWWDGSKLRFDNAPVQNSENKKK